METALALTTPAALPAQYGNREKMLAAWIHAKDSERTQRAYRFELARFLAYLEGRGVPLERAIAEDIDGYLASLGMPEIDEAGNVVRPALGVASRARALSAVKSLYRFAQASMYMPYNPTVLTKLPKVNNNAAARHALTESTIEEMLTTSTTHAERVILMTLYYTGLRVSEMCGLRWRDLLPTPGAPADGCPGQIYVVGKGNKERYVGAHRKAWAALQGFRPAGASEDEFVFTGPRGGRFDPVRIFRMVRAAASRVGLEGNVSPHWLRHTFATRAWENGAPLEVVSKALGHASVAVTAKVYVHFDNARPASAYLN